MIDLRLVNILGTHLCAHKTRVRCVHQNVRVSIPCYLTIKVPRVQNSRQLAPSVLLIRPEVRVELVEARKLQIVRHAPVHIARQIDNAHDIDGAATRRLGCLLHQRQKVRRENDVAHVVKRHVSVDAIVGELVRHDATPSVVD